jgi:hypothetical protein
MIYTIKNSDYFYDDSEKQIFTYIQHSWVTVITNIFFL